MQCASLIANSPMRHAPQQFEAVRHHHPFGRHIEQIKGAFARRTHHRPCPPSPAGGPGLSAAARTPACRSASTWRSFIRAISGEGGDT